MTSKSGKKFVFTTLAGGFVMWVVAGIWHNLIMASLYEQVHARHEGIGILLIAYFILAMFMAYLYPLGFKGKNTVKDGLRLGVVVGLLWVFPHGLAMAGAHGESILYVAKNSLWHMVEQGIGGIVVAVTYNRM
ncbi:MAG: hypothetical protein OEY50_04010 [Nitrospinota bacterium]|nr:hypothetical protein [Nitrospinota bacterium]MDH5678565.1 hypothetical protein [Nitrospinota bacterium]MDH5755104.1 hypothetical protein [Nitrospinota bacterium]